ncbi:protein Churchill-like [Pomacea canaliculata]|uniref:protein Churchill-like n=1 Tax=Pomacea canaliculata TaxID=400727 RepID=UPI000D729C23|nr:protein Churchill-like [Pomacea canaliculata]
MCLECVKEEFPERETTCLESGSYLLNYAGCQNCSAKDLQIMNRICTEEDEEELITYQHVCSQCNHVVANHEYTFKVEGEYQEYEMSCMLCGNGEDSRSIMPYDPRGPKT